MPDAADVAAHGQVVRVVDAVGRTRRTDDEIQNTTFKMQQRTVHKNMKERPLARSITVAAAFAFCIVSFALPAFAQHETASDIEDGGRVYRQGWFMTLVKYCALGFCYTLLVSIGVGLTALLSLVWM